MADYDRRKGGAIPDVVGGWDLTDRAWRLGLMRAYGGAGPGQIWVRQGSVKAAVVGSQGGSTGKQSPPVLTSSRPSYVILRGPSSRLGAGPHRRTKCP